MAEPEPGLPPEPSPGFAPGAGPGRSTAGPRSLVGVACRWVTTAYALVGGSILAVAPHAGAIWNDAFWAGHPALQAVLWTTPVRWGISALGGLLVAVGAWDVAKFIVDEAA